MNKTIFTVTIKQWLKSPFRLLALTLTFLGFIADRSLNLYMMELPPLEASYTISAKMGTFVLILGIGIIGLQRSSGNLSLTFARPIERSTYVLTKWIVLSIAAITISLSELLVEHAIYSVYMPELFFNFNFFPNMLERVLTCLGGSATMIFFSSIVPHTGDFMAWGCCFFVTTLIKSASESVLQYLDPEWITSFIDRAIYVLALAGEFICSISASFLMPSLDVRNDFLAGDTALLGIVTLVSNITIALMLSIWFMNRKEVTYGSA